MTDACTIARAGSRTFDDDTGEYTDTPTVIYTGKCRIKPSGVEARRVQASDTAVTIWPYIVSVPMAAVGIHAGDELTVTSSVDPALTDKTLVVRSIVAGTHVTARRIGCEDQATR